jgi:hypothetical protein
MSDWDAAISTMAGVVGKDFRAALAEEDAAAGGLLQASTGRRRLAAG